jgi:hypothetical protein
LAAALAQLGRLDEAQSGVKVALALNPAFTISRARAAWAAMSDNPTYLAQLEPILEGMRKAGLPESSPPPTAGKGPQLRVPPSRLPQWGLPADPQLRLDHPSQRHPARHLLRLNATEAWRDRA